MQVNIAAFGRELSLGRNKELCGRSAASWSVERPPNGSRCQLHLPSIHAHSVGPNPISARPLLVSTYAAQHHSVLRPCTSHQRAHHQLAINQHHENITTESTTHSREHSITRQNTSATPDTARPTRSTFFSHNGPKNPFVPDAQPSPHSHQLSQSGREANSTLQAPKPNPHRDLCI